MLDNQDLEIFGGKVEVASKAEVLGFKLHSELKPRDKNDVHVNAN